MSKMFKEFELEISSIIQVWLFFLTEAAANSASSSSQQPPTTAENSQPSEQPMEVDAQGKDFSSILELWLLLIWKVLFITPKMY